MMFIYKNQMYSSDDLKEVLPKSEEYLAYKRHEKRLINRLKELEQMIHEYEQELWDCSQRITELRRKWGEDEE